MFKKFITTVVLLTIAFSAAACSSDSKKEESAPATESAATESASTPVDETISKTQAYIAARVAEEKVEDIFHQVTSTHGEPVESEKIADVKFILCCHNIFFELLNEHQNQRFFLFQLHLFLRGNPVFLREGVNASGIK